jgi:hypothetical protein
MSIILWRARCGPTKSTEEGRCVATDSHATIEGTAVFFVVRSEATMGWRKSGCFLWGPTPGYITRGSYSQSAQRRDHELVGWQFAVPVRQLRVSWRWVAEKSPEELVDGQWEPVGSAGGPGPWRDSAGVVTQLWESVVIVRDSVVCNWLVIQ